jgi:hypothetical protein
MSDVQETIPISKLGFWWGSSLNNQQEGRNVPVQVIDYLDFNSSNYHYWCEYFCFYSLIWHRFFARNSTNRISTIGTYNCNVDYVSCNAKPKNQEIKSKNTYLVMPLRFKLETIFPIADPIPHFLFRDFLAVC